MFALLVDTNDLPNPNTSDFTVILNFAFAFAGGLAFLLLVIAGLRYTLSGGNADKVAESKRMIIYTLIGLVVIGLAASIVNFVLERA
jgi:hypothetical protein